MFFLSIRVVKSVTFLKQIYGNMTLVKLPVSLERFAEMKH